MVFLCELDDCYRFAVAIVEGRFLCPVHAMPRIRRTRPDEVRVEREASCLARLTLRQRDTPSTNNSRRSGVGPGDTSSEA